MLLGEKLKKARKNIGMSQNEVAEELMLSRQTISKWENNVSSPIFFNVPVVSSPRESSVKILK